MCKKLVFLTFVILMLVTASANVTLGDVCEGRVNKDSDDTEELDTSGTPEGGSSDLEIPYEDEGMGDKQLIGIRWEQVDIPKGATILNAWIEFVVDETKDGTLPVSLIIDGELNPNPPTFTTTNPFEIADRQPRTTAQAIWEPEEWTTVDEKHQTSDISVVIAEIINQEGWIRGNSLVLIIRDNPDNPSQGIRCAESYGGSADGAPLLHIEYTLGNATGPYPVDETSDVSRDVVLRWTPGAQAAVLKWT